MTKKDYVAFVATLRPYVTRGESEEDRALAVAIVRSIADTFAEDNPRFSRSRFLTATGVDDEE